MTGKAQESATFYNYDENYNRTYLRDGEGNETTFAYDDNNQLTQVAAGGQTTTFQYDNVGNRTRKDLPNAAYTTYNYGERNWLTSLENRKSDDSLISSYAYGHDDVGNRTSMTEANGDVTSYLYDDVYRLTSEEKRDAGEELLYRYQYAYDGVGNRLTMTNAGEVTYSYDANNKLTQLVGPSGTTTFGYDANGNMTSMTVPGPVEWDYGYDYENRLVSVGDNEDYTAGYTYSPDGLRLRVQESNNPNPDRWFQYDGVRPVLEGTLADDAFTTVNKYVWEGGSYYDSLVSASIGGSNKSYLYDGLGSTRQLLDSNQDVTDTYVYEAFGNLTGSTGATANPYRYVGSLGYYQTGSSLMHLGARYYMPEVGRFTSLDPIRVGTVWHVYGRSNPMFYVDPTGTIWGIIIGGVVVVGIGYLVGREANRYARVRAAGNKAIDYTRRTYNCAWPQSRATEVWCNDIFLHCLYSCYLAGNWGGWMADWAADRRHDDPEERPADRFGREGGCKGRKTMADCDSWCQQRYPPTELNPVYGQ